MWRFTAESLPRQVERAYADIKWVTPVDTYARSSSDDTRRKAAKLGAVA